MKFYTLIVSFSIASSMDSGKWTAQAFLCKHCVCWHKDGTEKYSIRPSVLSDSSKNCILTLGNWFWVRSQYLLAWHWLMLFSVYTQFIQIPYTEIAILKGTQDMAQDDGQGLNFSLFSELSPWHQNWISVNRLIDVVNDTRFVSGFVTIILVLIAFHTRGTKNPFSGIVSFNWSLAFHYPEENWVHSDQTNS